MPNGRLRVQFFNDFTGGLNNNQQRQNLSLNETPDCLDVTFNARGGFTTRNGFKTLYTDALLSGGYIGGQFSTGTEQLWGITSTGGLWLWDGTSFVTPVTSNLATNPNSVRGVTWTSKLYFSNWLSGGSYLMRYWNGTSIVTLGNVSNNNYSAPSGANAPQARLIANHSGHMWWADTVESGTRYRSRLRFSHPLQPENFADADYFDIEPDDQTNEITALIPFKNMLLVFKKRGVFAVYGTGRETFVVERVSTDAGVGSQEGVSANSQVAYWWSPDGNVFAFNGSNVVPIGDRIVNVVRDKTIIPGADHRVLWGEEKLWVSLQKQTGGRLLFLFDPFVGKNGAWTRFSFEPADMFWWRRNDGTSQVVFTVAGKSCLYQFGDILQVQDNDNGVISSIAAYYRMAWFTANDTALKKKWRRPTVTVASTTISTLNVEVYYDFDEAAPNRVITLQIAPTAGTYMVWGDNWGGLWSTSDPVYEFDRLSSLGRSNAVQLKFQVTGHTGRWWVDSIAVPYFEKAYR
jgi:hypothetical protein